MLANQPRQQSSWKSCVCFLIYLKRRLFSLSYLKITFVILLDPPEIEIERSWIHTGVHQEAYLTCIVHAEPGANVRERIDFMKLERRDLKYSPCIFSIFRYYGTEKSEWLFLQILVSWNRQITNIHSSYVTLKNLISDFILVLPTISSADHLKILNFPVQVSAKIYC